MLRWLFDDHTRHAEVVTFTSSSGIPPTHSHYELRRMPRWRWWAYRYFMAISMPIFGLRWLYTPAAGRLHDEIEWRWFERHERRGGAIPFPTGRVGVQYDREHDLLYLAFSSLPAARTEKIDEARLVDYGAGGELVGVELLSPSHGVRIGGLPEPDTVSQILSELGVEHYRFRTRSGQCVTDADLDQAAEAAERGFDLRHWRPRS